MNKQPIIKDFSLALKKELGLVEKKNLNETCNSISTRVNMIGFSNYNGSVGKIYRKYKDITTEEILKECFTISINNLRLTTIYTRLDKLFDKIEEMIFSNQKIKEELVKIKSE